VDLPINSEVTQPSLDLFLIVNCWQTLFRKAHLFQINLINLLNVSKGCLQNADAVWHGTKIISIGYDLRALRMLLYLYM